MLNLVIFYGDTPQALRSATGRGTQKHPYATIQKAVTETWKAIDYTISINGELKATGTGTAAGKGGGVFSTADGAVILGAKAYPWTTSSNQETLSGGIYYNYACSDGGGIYFVGNTGSGNMLVETTSTEQKCIACYRF